MLVFSKQLVSIHVFHVCESTKVSASGNSRVTEILQWNSDKLNSFMAVAAV